MNKHVASFLSASTVRLAKDLIIVWGPIILLSGILLLLVFPIRVVVGLAYLMAVALVFVATFWAYSVSCLEHEVTFNRIALVLYCVVNAGLLGYGFTIIQILLLDDPTQLIDLINRLAVLWLGSSFAVIALNVAAATALHRAMHPSKRNIWALVAYMIGFGCFPIGVWFLQPRINRAYAALTAEPPVEPPAL